MDIGYFPVPWYSMEEWNVVYRLVYSSSMDDMKKAYRRLLVWKERVENLPAGVECTLGILQVRLRELELSNSKESLLSHEDLQLMYSTAIIRFLNMIAELEQGRGQGPSTLYYKAQGMAIPSWIVNLRHDAAHSSVLPALHSLKAAADFIFTWLNDYYWKNEAEHTHDYYTELPPTSAVYKRNIRNILSLLEIYLALTASKSQSVSDDIAANLSNLLPNITSSDKDLCVSSILSGLSKKLNKESNKHDILTLILEETDFLSSSADEQNTSRTQLHATWTPILNILNKHQLLLDLMRLLVGVLSHDDEDKRDQAAQWIDDISKGFAKLERCLQIKLDLLKRGLGTELSSRQQFELIVKVADSTYSKLRKAIVLKGRLPHEAEFKELLEEALRSPSQYTMVFLDSLCFLTHVPKPPLVQLLNLYLNKSSCGSHSDSSHLTSVFTVDSLPRLRGESPEASQTCNDVDMKEEEEVNVWSLADDLDWIHCPLGSVPGQSDDMYIDFEVLENQ